MRVFRLAALALATSALLTTGCIGDLAQQVASNPQVAEQVMTVITNHQDQAMTMLDKLTATDSLQVKVIDHMLQNDAVAAKLLDRVATNPMALDLVLQRAVQDPAMKAHLVSVVEGIKMADAAAK
jgi:PBP1b-binding outer membrane lipoprotein LpoB